MTYELSSDQSTFELWFSSVGADGRPYPIEQHLLFFTGCFLWVIAYGLMLHRAQRNRFFEMAALAGASNFGWEVVWGLGHRTDMGQALVWCYRAWFVIDIALFAALLLWGHKQISHPWLRRHFKPLLVAGTIFFGVGYELFVQQGLDTTIGATSAYVCQFILSLSCLLLLLRTPTVCGFYRDTGALRTLGTGLVTAFMFLHYPDKPLILFLATTSTLLDVVYVAVLQARHTAGETAGPPGLVEAHSI